MRDKWKTYAQYKKLNRLPESPVLQSFEEFVQQTELYNVLEFSQKYVNRNGHYHCNPLRFLLYSVDLRISSPFLKKGFACFREILTGMKCASDLESLKASFLVLPRKNLEYLMMGIEMNKHIEKTRLKIYTGYRSQVNHHLVRTELNLNGEIASSRYESSGFMDERTKWRLRNLPNHLSGDCFSEVFFQGNSLHFMINRAEEMKAWKLVRKMMPTRNIRDHLSAMIANGFHLFVMRAQRQEIQRNDLKSFTLYFR